MGGTLGDVMPADTMAQFMAAAHDPQQFEAFLGRQPALHLLLTMHLHSSVL